MASPPKRVNKSSPQDAAQILLSLSSIASVMYRSYRIEPRPKRSRGTAKNQASHADQRQYESTRVVVSDDEEDYDNDDFSKGLVAFTKSIPQQVPTDCRPLALPPRLPNVPSGFLMSMN
jgi:hypothetical protein